MRKSLVAIAALALAVPAVAQSTDPNTGTPSGTPGQPSGDDTADRPSGTGTTGTTGSAGTAESMRGGTLAQDDREFIRQAAIGGMAEVELGRLATKQGQSEQVKRFGQKMVDDHSRANDELKKIALRLGADVPRELDSEHKQQREKLAGMSGTAFDREYLQVMREDHRKTIELFERQAKNGTSAELKSFAQKTLPVLEQHRKMLEQIQSGTGTSGTGTGTSSM